MNTTFVALALGTTLALAGCGKRAEPVASAPAPVSATASAKAERNLLTAKDNFKDDLAEATRKGAENQRAAEAAAGLEPAPLPPAEKK